MEGLSCAIRKQPAVGERLRFLRLRLRHCVRQRALQAETRAAAGSSWQEQNWSSPRTSGRRSISPMSSIRSSALSKKRTGLDKKRFYDRRHTHASLLISVGVHPKKVAERLGHASIKLTMDLYGHLFEGSDRESAARMQKMFGDDSEESRITGGYCHGSRLALKPQYRMEGSGGRLTRDRCAVESCKLKPGKRLR